MPSSPEPPKVSSDWKSFKDGLTIVLGTVFFIGGWVVTAIIVLVLGAAIIKWAIEELSK